MGLGDKLLVSKLDVFEAMQDLVNHPAPDGVEDSELMALAVDQVWAFLLAKEDKRFDLFATKRSGT